MTMPLVSISRDASSWPLARAFGRMAALAGAQAPPPCLLLALPAAWHNRYQVLLYGQAGPMGYAPMGLNDPALLEQVSWPGPILLHAHWFNGLFASCETEVAARARLDLLQAQLGAFRARTGARLVWTAHNIFPHGNRFPDTFLKLRQWVFESFDALHVLDPGHVAQLEAAYGRKAPAAFAVPHMLYTGSHPDSVSPAAARAQYGIAPEAFVFGYFGSIHGYKRLDRFLSAFERVAAAADRPAAALIGGMPSDPATAQLLVQGWGRDPRIRLELRLIPDHEIQYLHRASDAMVLPYAETLNSGAAFMAASFGMPFLMPQGRAAAALAGLGVIRFDPAAPDGLEQAMAAVMKGQRGDTDPAAWDRAAPNAVSAAFFAALDGVIGRERSWMSGAGIGAGIGHGLSGSA